MPANVVDELVAEYQEKYEVVPELAAGGACHESLRYAAQLEAGLRSFLTDGGFTAFTTNFEDLGGLRQLPGIAVQRLMADGYGFGGEGDWKTSVLSAGPQGHGRRASRWDSFMEDYTYHFGPGEPKNPRRSHARGLPEHRSGQTKVRDPSLEHRRAARILSGSSSTQRLPKASS